MIKFVTLCVISTVLICVLALACWYLVKTKTGINIYNSFDKFAAAIIYKHG
jgi:hypothetical protein